MQLMRGRRCLNPESMMCNNGIAACGQFRSWSLLGGVKSDNGEN